MTTPLSPLAFETLAQLLKTKSGLIIGMDKLYLLETRLGRHRQAGKASRSERRWRNGCGARAAMRWLAMWWRQ